MLRSFSGDGIDHNVQYLVIAFLDVCLDIEAARVVSRLDHRDDETAIRALDKAQREIRNRGDHFLGA